MVIPSLLFLERSCRFDAVIHFAGRKYVNESVENPLAYYDHNVVGTVQLAKAMKKHGCKNVSRMYISSSLSILYDHPPKKNKTFTVEHRNGVAVLKEQKVFFPSTSHVSMDDLLYRW